jgi:hypothetical protein
MEIAYDTLLDRPTVRRPSLSVPGINDEKTHPFILTMGGDPTIVRILISEVNRLTGVEGVPHSSVAVQTAWTHHCSSF